MAKIKIINVGPVEWFSPHFAYDDATFVTYNYNPLREKSSLIEFCNQIKPDVLYIFRGDLVRSQLFNLKHIYQIEFSSEIYPTNPFSNKYSQWISVKKFMHCLRDLDPYANIYHYDKSRSRFFDAIDMDMKFHFLPVNLSFFKDQKERDIDILFFGRASERRMRIFSKLKESALKFVWIENGLDWSELSAYISRAKVTVNFAADECDNFEPRILLGIAGGSFIITEPSIGLDMFLKEKPSFSNLIKICQPDSAGILNIYNRLNKEGNFGLKRNCDIMSLSSNSFISRELGL